MAFLRLHCLGDDLTDGVCGVALHLLRRVGVGAQREARAEVSQGGGERRHVHAVLEGQGSERVPEIVEADVLRADRFEDLVVRVAE